MLEGLVNQFDVMTLGEEIYTICFTAFMVGGSVCCCARCLRPEPAETAATLACAGTMSAVETKPQNVSRASTFPRPAPPRRPRRLLASRSAVPPCAYRRLLAADASAIGAHAACD